MQSNVKVHLDLRKNILHFKAREMKALTADEDKTCVRSLYVRAVDVVRHRYRFPRVEILL